MKYRRSCIYDVASNGNTITTIEFRNGGTEILSKSHQANIRVWDISRYDESAYHARNSLSTYPQQEQNVGDDSCRLSTNSFISKPNYEDIGNTQDARCLIAVGGFAYGGTYQFSVFNFANSSSTNAILSGASCPLPSATKDNYEMPERINEEDCSNPYNIAGLRRRR